MTTSEKTITGVVWRMEIDENGQDGEEIEEYTYKNTEIQQRNEQEEIYENASSSSAASLVTFLEERQKTLQKKFDAMVALFYTNWTKEKKFLEKNEVHHELEVRFGLLTQPLHRLSKPLSVSTTMSNVPIQHKCYLPPYTKNDYENVIAKLKSLGFVSNNEQGYYQLKIFYQYINKHSGTKQASPSRIELETLPDIQSYCETNSLQELLQKNKESVRFIKKEKVMSSVSDTKEKKMFPNRFGQWIFMIIISGLVTKRK